MPPGRRSAAVLASRAGRPSEGGSRWMAEGFGENLLDRHARIERRVGVLEDDVHAAAQRAHLRTRWRAAEAGLRRGLRPRWVRCRRSRIRATVVLPQPDSPTRPSVSPVWMANETSSTTRVTPLWRAYSLIRPRASISGCGAAPAKTRSRRWHSRNGSIPDGLGRAASCRRCEPQRTMKIEEFINMADAISLAGKTVLITGASSGIGWAARCLRREGREVVVTARRQERLRELCGLIAVADGKAVSFAGDAAAQSTAKQCVALAVSVRQARHPHQQCRCRQLQRSR